MFCTYSKNYYEGRSINKLQNDIILLIFKIWKFRNIHFVVNLIGDIYWNFYDDDSLLWTSLILRTHWLTSQCCILPSSSLLQLASVEQHCELNEKSEQVQQANVFKRQTLMFHFSTYRPNSFKHLSVFIPSHVGLTAWGNRPCNRCTVNTSRVDHEQTFYPKQVLLVLQTEASCHWGTWGTCPPSIATVVLIGLYFLKCTRFDQLILRKIIKIVATRCQILTLKCTKIDFGWGSAPDPAGGAYSAPPDPLAGFKGAYF